MYIDKIDRKNTQNWQRRIFKQRNSSRHLESISDVRICFHSYIRKMYFSHWECLRVVGPESQGGQILEFTGPMQWPSGAPGSTWECQRQAWKRQPQAWEHLGAPVTCLGAPTTSLGAPRITVEPSAKNIIFGNAAGVPGNHSYYLLCSTIFKTNVFSLSAARLHFISPPKSPQNRGQATPNLHDYHSNPTMTGNTCWVPDITNWPFQHNATHRRYANHTTVAPDITSIQPEGVEVEASFSFVQGAISWRQSKTTGETLCGNVVVRQFALANNGILAGNDPALHSLNTESDFEMMREIEERNLHRMDKVHNIFKMWQGSHHLSATQWESGAQNKQMTAV